MTIDIIKTNRITGSCLRDSHGTCLAETYSNPTNELCWHCCHTFETNPVPFPIRHDDKKRVYTVAGKFCSFACMSAYNRDYGKLHGGFNKGMAIFSLYKDMTGKKTPPIPPSAPPRQFLKAFGGWMDIVEFRTISEQHEYIPLSDKCIPMQQVYLERDTGDTSRNIRGTSVTRFLDSTNSRESGSKAETLKLKKQATKVTPSKESTKRKTILEQTLGLV